MLCVTFSKFYVIFSVGHLLVPFHDIPMILNIKQYLVYSACTEMMPLDSSKIEP